MAAWLKKRARGEEEEEEDGKNEGKVIMSREGTKMVEMSVEMRLRRNED